MATNAEWCIKNGYKFKNIHIEQSRLDFCIYEIYIGKALIDTYGCTNERTQTEIITKWLDAEHKEPILDEAEKKYLSAVIRPFRDRVKHICKVNFLGVSSSEYQRIYITLSDGSYNIDLPIFKTDTMYKGMEPEKEYTLEELGL